MTSSLPLSRASQAGEKLKLNGPNHIKRFTGWEEGLVPAVAWPGNISGDKSLFPTCY